MLNTKKKMLLAAITALTAQQTYSAVALDRTRIIYDGGQKNVSLNISNQNKELPFLAQSWLEDEQGVKVNGPLIALPPVQRIEPGAKSMVKLQSMPEVRSLPQDRESLYYFNMREIPPRSDKPNVLQIALQTRVKLFYRPDAIRPESNIDEEFKKISLTPQGSFYLVNNDTPYYFTVINASSKKTTDVDPKFVVQMIKPLSHTRLDVDPSAMGDHPVLTYINDYGARPMLTFNCIRNNCVVVDNDQHNK